MGVLTTVIAIVAGICMFLFLVLIHELGHFLTAKKFGVHVKEFGLGIPPKIATLWTDKKGTAYTLNAIPLGGFVRLKGEDPDNKKSFWAKDSFLQAKVYHKLLILIGGIVVNAVFAWLVFFMLFLVGIKPLSILPDSIASSNSYLMPSISTAIQRGILAEEDLIQPVLIEKVQEGSPAQELNIQEGDVITQINGQDVFAFDLAYRLADNTGEGISVRIERDNTIRDMTYQCPEDSCVLGIAIRSFGTRDAIQSVQFGFGGSALAASEEVVVQTTLMLESLGGLFMDLVSFEREKVQDSLGNLAGPVGAVGIGMNIFAIGGLKGYLAFAAMISLALAVFNLLPLPVLDGGRMVGVVIQSTFRLPKEKYFIIEGYLNTFFFILLMVLGIYIIFQDLARVWGVSFW